MLQYVFILCIGASFLFIWYYFSLIAKFYRLKSGQGLHQRYYYFAGFVFTLGILSCAGFSYSALVRYLSAGLITVGGMNIILLALNLYRNMMSVNKNSN
ncbi:MAG: hypothetical protein HQK83_20430 [Fibrobacteria bacterium]|nr:hypothetical protein [Fibrobacteria bacterium]